MKRYKIVKPRIGKDSDGNEKTYWDEVGGILCDDAVSGLNGASLFLPLIGGKFKVYSTEKKQEPEAEPEPVETEYDESVIPF